MRDSEYRYHNNVNWSPLMDSVEAWDEVATWVIEHYGLPGDRYITDMSPDWMTWSFKDSRDAFFMRLRFGEVIERKERATHE